MIHKQEQDSGYKGGEKTRAARTTDNTYDDPFDPGGGEIMAKIVQSLTRATQEYNQKNIQSLVRDLDSVITKLNTTFQEEVKQEIEAKSFFLE